MMEPLDLYEIVGVSIASMFIALTCVAGLYVLFGKQQDNYASPRQRPNIYKVPR